MKALIDRNIEILKYFRKELASRITADKVRNQVLRFLDNAQLVTRKIGEVIPPEMKEIEPVQSNGQLLNEFKKNTEILLKAVPEADKKKVMSELPQTVANAITKVATYLGDDSWMMSSPGLKAENPSFDHFSGGELAMEDSGQGILNASDQSGIRSDHRPTLGQKQQKAKSNKEKDRIGYPEEYHKLSPETTIGLLLDPLFDQLFARDTYIASEKHCRKTTGRGLNKVFQSRLGPGMDGNRLLYKLLTDDVLKKIFNDDRIIALFDQSIHIGLLKVVIATALYRIERTPKKFPMLGGVSFFMDIENRMLKSDRICSSLVQLIVRKQGAIAFFSSASSSERKGFIDRLEENSELAHSIIDSLPENPTAVTRCWLPKFSALVIVRAGLQESQLRALFPEEQLMDIQQFISYVRPMREKSPV